MTSAQTHSPTPTPLPRPFVLGLAGGIGSGKSAAARCLADLGCLVIDFDAEAKAALDAPTVRRRLIEWWGIDMVDAGGRVDRAAVARVVFGDEACRVRLEKLVHPLVWRTREGARNEAERAAAPGIVLDAPLLFEAGLDASCDAVLFIDSTREVRAERVAGRGWPSGEMARREAAQWPTEEKMRRSDFQIPNNGTIDELREAMSRLFAILTGRAEPASGR